MPINRREFKKIVDVLESMVKEKDAEESGIRPEREPAVAVKNFLAGERLDQPVMATRPDQQPTSENDGTFERLYLRIKNRIIDECRVDPVLLTLLMSRPEIEVAYEARVFEYTTSTLKGRIAALIASGFFKDVARQPPEVRRELSRIGKDPGSDNIGRYLNEFLGDAVLLKEGGGYIQAPGIKITEKTLESRA